MSHDDPLRVALCAMLDDPAYPEPAKDRPWVEARLREATWTAGQRWMLLRKLVVWGKGGASIQAAALAKALGQAAHERDDTDGRA